jgi:hypothetical protein
VQSPQAQAAAYAALAPLARTAITNANLVIRFFIVNFSFNAIIHSKVDLRVNTFGSEISKNV